MLLLQGLRKLVAKNKSVLVSSDAVISVFPSPIPCQTPGSMTLFKSNMMLKGILNITVETAVWSIQITFPEQVTT
jgi:hypothetical protein